MLICELSTGIINHELHLREHLQPRKWSIVLEVFSGVNPLVSQIYQKNESKKKYKKKTSPFYRNIKREIKMNKEEEFKLNEIR